MVGGVGFEPTHPKGNGFTDRRSSPSLQPTHKQFNDRNVLRLHSNKDGSNVDAKPPQRDSNP